MVALHSRLTHIPYQGTLRTVSGAPADRPAAGGDFEELLADLEGRPRAARLMLLQQLRDSGVPLSDLRQAVGEGRLAMLPIERFLFAENEYTIADYVRETGLGEEFIRNDLAALGLPVPAPQEHRFSEADLEDGRRLKQFLDAGISEEDILELARVVGRASAAAAEGVIQIAGRTFLNAESEAGGDAVRLALAAEHLVPLLGPLMANPFRLHLQEVAKREVVGRSEEALGALPDAREVTISFADLVDFTRLSSRSSTVEVAAVAQRLEILAASAIEPPTRLVKLIGDAAMFAGTETRAVVQTSINLTRAVEEARDLPKLRVGVARGLALNRSGDWYGQAVNLASRVSASSEPGQIWATGAVRDQAAEAGEWREAGRHALKGIAEPVELFALAP